jgi:hypothetical protein
MMSRLVRCFAVVVVASLTSAAAPFDPAARRCVDGYNARLERVSLQAGLSFWRCVRGALQGRQTDLDGCVVRDRGGAVAARQARVAELFDAGTCRGDEPLQQGAAAGNAAHAQAAVDLAHDLFGDPLDPLGGGPADRRCLDAGAGEAVVGLSALLRAHRQCVARGLRDGSITDEQTLSATCGARAQVGNPGRAPAVLARAADAVAAACAGRPTTALFHGLELACHASPAALAACIERAAACRACLASDASNWTPIADGTQLDCDAFDDGVANLSCGEFPFPPWSLCRLGTDSRLLLSSIGLPLALQLRGAVRIDCGSPAADGRADCRCDLDEAGILVIPAIGDVCIEPHDGCPPGFVDCDGGSAVGVDLAIDHDLGSCSGHADCAQACTARCAARGPTYVVAGAACEGFCLGPADGGMACTNDADCPGAQCVGRDPVSHGAICNCTCQGTELGPPAGAGALSCRLGMQINVELPSNGVCRGPVTISNPPFCSALTTGAADALITDANGNAGSTLDQFRVGVPTGAAIFCPALAVGQTAGLSLVGTAVGLDTTLGDFLTTTLVTCE